MRLPDPVSSFVQCVLAPNPGPMTLSGTNTYVIGAPGSPGSVVVDPGPDDPGHLDRIVEAAGRVDLVILTHRHADHTGGLAALLERTGAPSRARLPEFSRGAQPLHEDETIEAAGTALRILATPGHTADSISVLLPEAGPHGALLTGDTILGGSTTMIDHPDGTLADYFATLDRIEALGEALILPAHGEPIAGAADEARRLRGHRLRRLEQVAEARDRLRDARPESAAGADADDILDIVYADAPERVRAAARASIEAQLSFLRRARG